MREEFCVVFARLISTLACRHTVHLRKYLRRERGRTSCCEMFDMEHALTGLQTKPNDSDRTLTRFFSQECEIFCHVFRLKCFKSLFNNKS